MNESHEFQPAAESKDILNHDFSELVNKCLNATISEFDKLKNKDNLKREDDPRREEFLKNLDVICETVADDSDLKYIIRGQKYNQDKNIFYINISPEDTIDYINTTKEGICTLKIKPNTTIKETQISIKPFCEYSGSKPDPAKIISQTGYIIDFSVCDVSSTIDQFGNQKIKFSSKLAGLGIRLYDDDKCFAFLKTYIGDEDFRSKKISIENKRESSQKVLDFCSTNLSNPTNKF